jgi:tRNA dimethylallyltransferase
VKKPKLLVIVGPTASGKTTLALKLARKFSGEIVSADSRQIYRGMNIGTAKAPVKANGKWQMANGIIHHLIDIKNPDEDYTVAEYKNDAINAIRTILKKKKLPILVGGTGLYVKAVVDNLDIPAVRPDVKLREKLEREITAKGLPHLFQKLIELDPEAAYIVDGKNPRRVIRALEVALITGKPFTAQRKKGERLFDSLKIGMYVAPGKLKKRIERRADKMVKNGLGNEVKQLVKKYGTKPVAFDAIGYREIINYLETRIGADQGADRRGYDIRKNQRFNRRESASLNEAVELIKKKTWDFAKRQMTWFRKDKEIQWIKSDGEALPLVRKFLLKKTS